MADEIFISYSRTDEAFARRLAMWITKTLNLGVWIDIEDIMPGIKWSAAIQEGLDDSKVMIVIITPTAMRSRNVEDEWQYFLDQEKPIIPLLLKSAVIPYQLRRIQYIDFSVREEYNESLRLLVMEVRRHIKPTEAETIASSSTQHLSTQTVPAATPSKAAKKRKEERQRTSRRKNRLILSLGISTLLLSIAAAALLFMVLQDEETINLTLLAGDSNDVRIFANLNDTEGRIFTPGDTIRPGERVETGDSVVAVGDPAEGASAVIEQNSDVVIEEMDDDSAVIGVADGSASVDGAGGQTQVQTPNNIDVNGPNSRVTVSNDELVAECAEGCDLTDQTSGESRTLDDNQSIAVQTGQSLLDAEIRELWGSIVFTSLRRGAAELYTMDRDGSNQRQLTETSQINAYPAWSPDGTQIVFSRGGADLWLIDLSNPNAPRETSLTGDMDLQAETLPAWSPDGTQIAFVANSSMGTPDIYVIDLATEDVRQITTNPGVDTDPAWSPDGTQLVFSSVRDGGTHLYTLDLLDENAEPFQITNGDENDTEPAWSPDGTQIAFVRGESVNRDIFLVGPRGGDATPLITASNADLEPTWGPSGEFLLFVSQRAGNNDIWLAPISQPSAATNLTNLTGSDDESPNWLPQLRAGA